MIRINNYTAEYEIEAETIEELEHHAYIRANRAKEAKREPDEVMYTVTETGITGYDNAVEWLELEEDERDLCEAIAYKRGYGYFKSIQELSDEAGNVLWSTIEGVSSDYELAHHLMYDLNSDEEILFSILGCTKEAYEQLSSYITTDALASTIDIERSVAYVGNKAYLFIN